MRLQKRLSCVLLCGATAVLAASCASSPRIGTLREPGRWSGDTVVQTRFGLVQGFPDSDNTLVWKAIPYAKPPLGDLRWRAPQDPEPWADVRAARSFNAGCTQFSPVFRGSITGSEDCLYLNVWRPRGQETGLPVYVWIHGGGNSIGSATMVPDYYGNRIAARSRVVFVSMNYRLGPFGWFTHPALRDGAWAEDASGNYGTLDIIQALKWIQQNIEAFGGDPHSVTITGESAGGHNVLSLLISPRARGLFHGAMSESGYANTHAMDEADARSRKVLDQLLVRDRKARTAAEAESAAAAMTPEQIRAFLRSQTDRQIERLYSTGGFGMIDNPDLLRDGAVIPESGFDSLIGGDYPGKVPVILGSNREEIKLFLAFAGNPPWKSDLYQAIATYSSARWKVTAVDEVARRLASHADQPPVYAYLFSWGAPDAQGKSPMPGNWGRRLGAFHSLEIPFFLGTDTLEGVLQALLFTRQNAPGRKALSGAMMDYLAQFARTGNPNRPGSGLPEWAPWTNAPGAPRSIVFDATADASRISMSGIELTDEGVLAAVSAELPEPLRTRTLAALSTEHTPSGVR
jgi:para-nitrobenzyl esterase